MSGSPASRLGPVASCALLAVLAGGCASTPDGSAPVDLPRNNVAVFFGARGAEGERSDGDVGGVVGVEYSRLGGEATLGWEAGLSYSEHEEFISFVGGDQELEIVQLYGGGRHTFPGVRDEGLSILPYIGAGISVLFLDGRGADDAALGAYGRVGTTFLISRSFSIGADLQGLASTSDDVEYYAQFAVLFGWSF